MELRVRIVVIVIHRGIDSKTEESINSIGRNLSVLFVRLPCKQCSFVYANFGTANLCLCLRQRESLNKEALAALGKAHTEGAGKWLHDFAPFCASGEKKNVHSQVSRMERIECEIWSERKEIWTPTDQLTNLPILLAAYIIPKSNLTTMDPTDCIIAKFLERFISRRTGKSFRFHPELFICPREILTSDLEHLPKSTSFVQDVETVTESLERVADKLREFLSDSYNERLVDLTESLVPKLKKFTQNGHEHSSRTSNSTSTITSQFNEAFKTVADEMFSQGISWSHIITFLVFGAELASKAIKLDKSHHPPSLLVHHLFECISEYFEHNLRHWIDQQRAGWLDFVRYEEEDSRYSLLSVSGDEDDNHINRNDNDPRGTMKHYFGAAAIAAVVGGLFLLCSKLSVQ